MAATAHQQLAASAMVEICKAAAGTGKLDRIAAQHAFDSLMDAYPTPRLRVVQVGDHTPEIVEDHEYDRELDAFAAIFGARG